MNNDENHNCECNHTHGDSCHCGEHEHHTHDDCCCGEHEHHTMTIITDDDEELKCSILGTFDVDDKEYIALLPVGEDEVLLYQFVLHDDDSFELLNIETDEEFGIVEDLFFELFGENLEDEDFEDFQDLEDGDLDFEDFQDLEDEDLDF